VSVGCVVMEKLNLSQKRETVNTVRNATFITDETIIGILYLVYTLMMDGYSFIVI
jgi:hypothetical protein